MLSLTIEDPAQIICSLRANKREENCIFIAKIIFFFCLNFLNFNFICIVVQSLHFTKRLFYQRMLMLYPRQFHLKIIVFSTGN